MKKLSLIIVLFVSWISFAQNSTNDWVVKPFSDLGFTENIGRYAPPMDEEVLYYADYADVKIFLTSHAFVFGKPRKLSKEQAHEYKEKLEHREYVEPIKWDYFKVDFYGTDKDVVIEPQGLKHHTRNFQNPQNKAQTLKAQAYEQLVYKNLYPNIDMLVELPEEGGMKYSFKIHPGGEANKIQMHYSGVSVSKQEDGTLLMESAFFSFRDAAPEAFTENNTLDVAFECEDNTVSFAVESYDLSETLIIDPWLETILPFSTNNDGYEIGYDHAGNCMIMGGTSDEIAMYDSEGVLQWTWNEDIMLVSYLGDMTTNPGSGDIYTMRALTEPLKRLDVTGTLVGTYLYDWETELQEAHRLSYDQQYDELWIGGGNPLSAPDIQKMNFDFTGPNAYDIYTVDDYPLVFSDVTLLENDPDGEFVYFLTTSWDDGIANTLNKVSRADPWILLWNTPTGHTFQEVRNVSYYDSGIDPDINGNGFNGIVCSAEFVFTYDGNRLQKYDKITGDILATTFTGEEEFMHAGLDLGPCDYLYVGGDASVFIYNSDLVEIGSLDMPAETFDLVVRDSVMYASGNSFVGEFELIAFEEGVDYALESTPAICDACNGAAIFTLSPWIECSTLTFEGLIWEHSGETTFDVADLCEGWYTVTSTWVDSEGIDTLIIDSVEVVRIDESLAIDFDITNVLCAGECNGIAELVPESGEGPFEYTLGMDINATGLFPDLCPGTYDVVVTDNIGCSKDTTIIITEPEELIAELSELVPVSCFGGADGSVIVVASGGTEPYSFDIGEGAFPSGEFTDLTSGTYTVMVTDNNSCTAEISFDIEEPEELILTEVSVLNVLCNGDATGEVEVLGLGGTGAHTYSQDGVTFDVSPVFVGLIAGTYTLYVRDENDCETTIDVNITEPELLLVDPSWTDETCEDICDGTISLDPEGGTEPYLFSVDACLTFEPLASFTGLCAEEYIFCVEDANGCRYTNTVTIASGIPPANATILPLGPFCEEEDAVFVEVVEPGTLSGSGIVGDFFDPGLAGPGTHTITNTIVDICGGAVATVDIIVNPSPVVNFTVDENAGCVPVNVIFSNTGDGGTECTWYFGDGSSSNTCDGVPHSYADPGTYDVSLTVVDGNGCRATTTYYDYFEAHPIPVAGFGFKPTTISTLDPTVFFTDESFGADNWVWYFDELGNSTDQNPVFLFPDREGKYDIEQIVISPHGCRDSIVKNITVTQEHLIFVPNIITPDGNAYNEIFKPHMTGVDIYDYHLTIFNRWGEVIFESFDLQKGWNGSYAGEIVQDGVYIWQIEAADRETDKRRTYRGHVTVTR